MNTDNYENLSIVDRVIWKIIRVTFYWSTVQIHFHRLFLTC